MKNEYDESDIERFPLKNGNFMVKLKDKEGADDEGISKKIQFSIMSPRFVYIVSLEEVDE